MNRNEEYFLKYCEIACDLFARTDNDCPAIKSMIRFVIREASNHSSELPGYDNKLGAEIVSVSVLEQLKKGDKEGLIGEHVVPVSVIINKLQGLTNKTVDEIKKTIKKLSKRAVITQKEDALLREQGLKQKMPVEWDGETVMARYEAQGVKIKTVDLRYKEAINSAKDN